MGRSDEFHWVTDAEPHSTRRREILAKHGDKVRKLYGYDHSTAVQVSGALLFDQRLTLGLSCAVRWYLVLVLPLPEGAGICREGVDGELIDFASFMAFMWSSV